MVEDDFSRKLDQELAKRCESWKYLLATFLLTTTPGLYNALHITVYVFITEPVKHVCNIQPLVKANWTFDQISNISSSRGSNGESCHMYSWDYNALANMGYQAAVQYTAARDKPDMESCSSFIYNSDDVVSVVQQWDLVCSRSYLTSLVQVAVAFGKFVGAFCFGIVADKFGRKRCFMIASFLYMVAGPLAAWVESFILFLALRFTLGLAGSAVYETGYVLLTELTVNKWRSRMSCVYGIFYPVGMVLLSLIAMNFSSWRMIQLSISLPTFFIILNCWFLPESPRWLLIKGRREEAWKILVGKKDASQNIELSVTQMRGSTEPMLKKQLAERTDQDHVWYKKCLVFIKEVFQIFTNSELRSRAIICNFSWFIASFCYYVIALNGVNLTSNLYLYIVLNGLFEAPGYILPVFLISYFGRKSSSIMSFFISGVSLLVILAIPSSLEGLRMIWAMVGKLWVSSIFSFISLHTSELFPTTNRNTAVGMTLTMSQIGSMSAPLLVQLGRSCWYIPSTVCGGLALLAGSFIFLLPETRDEPLSDTIQDVEKSKKVSFANCCSIPRTTSSSS